MSNNRKTQAEAESGAAVRVERMVRPTHKNSSDLTQAPQACRIDKESQSSPSEIQSGVLKKAIEARSEIAPSALSSAPRTREEHVCVLREQQHKPVALLHPTKHDQHLSQEHKNYAYEKLQIHRLA